MAEIILNNKTGIKSKRGYLVIEDTISNNGFKYVGVDALSTIGVVDEEVNNNYPCRIITSGQGVLYSIKPVKKGDILRSVKQGDGLPLGSVVVAKNTDTPYLRVGTALENGRGLVSAVISIEPIYTTLNGSGAPTVQWVNIIGVPPAVLTPIDGSGTTNYLSKFSAPTTLSDSLIFDNGSAIGIGTTSLNSFKLKVSGSIYGTSIGVNNTSPTYTLDVTGTGRYTGNLFAESNVGSVSYASGFAGSGWQLTNSSSEYSMTVDNLTVRKTMSVYELIINQIRASNGAIWVSDCGKLTSAVNTSTTYYQCSIDSDGGNIALPFALNDILRCQKWTGRGVKYYSAQVTDATSATDFTINIIDGAGVPEVGDDLVRVGNASNTSRQGSLYLTASDTNAPYLDVMDGVTSASFSGKVKARLGRLVGITDPLFGSLSGYGLWSENVYLSGSIKATGGQIAGWTIDTDAIYTGTKKTSAGYTTSGITIASNGSLRSKYFEIDTNGYAKFVSVDSIFKSSAVDVGNLSGTVVNTTANAVAVDKIVDYTFSGTNGTGTVRLLATGSSPTGTFTYATSISASIDSFIYNYGGTFSSAGYTLVHYSTNVMRVTGSTGLSYIPQWTNISGDVSATINTVQNYVAPVARVDTITLSGTGGIATMVCDGVTSSIKFVFDLPTTASSVASAYASSYSPGGVTVTSNGNDIILTSSTPGVDFTGYTTITNVPNNYRGRIKIEGNHIWEDEQTDSYSYIGINMRGYKGQNGDYYRSLAIGNGVGATLAYFRGFSSGSNTIGDIYITAPQIAMTSIPTSSAATSGVGYLYVDGSGYVRMRLT